MTYTIENYTLLKTRDLEKYDEITFVIGNERLQYKVESCWLSGLNCREIEIFQILKLPREEFCTDYYGYPCKKSLDIWPECEPEDMSALTRVTIALFECLNVKKLKLTSINIDFNDNINNR